MMRSGSRTVVSFLAVAMAATALGAVVQSRTHQGSSGIASAPVAAATVAPPGSGTPLTFDTFREIARSRNASVVNIRTRTTVRRPRLQSPFDFFGDDFFGGRRRQQEERNRRDGRDGVSVRSLGSGFVIDTSGYILTNNHVIDEVDDITVVLANGHEYDGKLVGQDARTDVALIKIEPKEPLTTLPMGNSDQAEVGEWVMAIGQPFGLAGNSVTVGVVSFKGRDLELGQRNTRVDMLQTDAAINPGNSGGPLLNTRGEVIGVNTMIATNGGAQNVGVGFAVPINVVKQILPQLREKGRVVRGWMGVGVRDMDADLALTYGLKEPSGAVVNEVTPGSPADTAGLLPEDVVIEADGRPMKTPSDLTSYVASQAPGTTVRLKVLRGRADNVKEFSLKLGTFPESSDQIREDPADRASLGMRLRDLTPAMRNQFDLPSDTKGVLVTDVGAGGAAEEAGLVEGDIIISVGGVAVDSVAQFESEIAKAKAAGIARLRVQRRGQNVVVALKVS